MKGSFLKTPITYLLVAINVLVFIILEFQGSTQSAGFMLEHGAMNPYMVLNMGEWYRLFTCMFMHFGLNHLISNMLLLIALGQYFEMAVGSVRYIIIYLLSGLCGSFLSFFYRIAVSGNDVVAGASGAIFGIVGGMLVVIIANKGRFAGITLKNMVLMAALTLYCGITTPSIDNIGHFGGLICGVLLTVILYLIPTSIKKKYQ